MVFLKTFKWLVKGIGFCITLLLGEGARSPGPALLWGALGPGLYVRSWAAMVPYEVLTGLIVPRASQGPHKAPKDLRGALSAP